MELAGFLQTQTTMDTISTDNNNSFFTVVENGTFINRSITELNTDHSVPNISFLHYELANLYNSTRVLSATDRAREIFKNPMWVFSIIVFLCGVLANIMTIQAIMYIPKHQRSAHLKFIISLACSDILILLAIFCGDVIYIFSSLHSDCTKLFKTLLLDVPLLATLLNLLAMALDHYLASFRQLHYPHLMTRSRGNCVICAVWVFSVSAVLTEILIGLDARTKTFDAFCMATVYDSYSIEQVITGTIFIVLLVIILIYIRIYHHVRKSLPRRPRKGRQSVSPSIKTLVTTMLFIGTFVLFWTPEGIFHIYLYIKSKTDINFINDNRDTITLVNDILFLILQLNSLADPIIYAVRLPKVKQGCRAVFCKKANNSEKPEKCYIQLKQTNYTSLSVSFLANRHTTTPSTHSK